MRESGHQPGEVTEDGPLARYTSGRDAETLAVLLSALADEHVFRSVWSVPKELSNDDRETEHPPSMQPDSADAENSGGLKGPREARQGGGEQEEIPLRLSAVDWLFELEMCRRCRGYDPSQHCTGNAEASSPSSPSPAGSAAWLDGFATTAACTCFCMWTPAATAILQLFSCIRVEEHLELNPLASGYQGTWMLQDLTQRCYSGAHLRYAVGVGLPGAEAHLRVLQLCTVRTAAVGASS